MNRRRFIQNMSAAVLLVNGKTLIASELGSFAKKKPVLRFAIASDAHFGQAQTPFQEYLDTAVSHMNKMHMQKAFDFGVINGDIVHDDISHFANAKKTLDNLSFKYFVTQGNHDLATPTEWEAAWNVPVDFDVVMGKNVLLFATTSNKKGVYLPPNQAWLEAKFEEHAGAEHLFLFIHIPPIKWTPHAIDAAGFQELVKKQKNLKAVFHGHEHKEDSVKWQDGIPYLFDSHVGGNWGTSYRGYRIVELYKDGSMLTWIMNPTEQINILDIKKK
jgi:3',5'-cyclic AMP phosphodiesterase CpdA